MGIFGKLFGGKDDFDFDSALNQDIGKPGSSPLGDAGMPVQDDLGLGEKSPFGDSPTTGTNPFDPPDKPSTSQGGLGEPQFGSSMQSQHPSAPTPPISSGGNKELELIGSKLDTIKAILDSLDRRIANLEKAVGADKKKENLW